MNTTTQTTIDIKTLDIAAKEWFDKVNGNSYHSVRVTINYGMPDEMTIYCPFTYGYGDHYQQTAFSAIQAFGLTPKQDSRTSAWRYYEENGIITRNSISRNCLKRDVIAWGRN